VADGAEIKPDASPILFDFERMRIPNAPPAKRRRWWRTIAVMSPELSELLKRALSLPVDERAALANTLLDSLEPVQESVQ
jgi:hypothetical protein